MPNVQASSNSSATEFPPNQQKDVEAQLRNPQKGPSHWQLVIDQTLVTPEVKNWPYKGSGTEDDPFVVVYIENDGRNPMLFSAWKKWVMTSVLALVSHDIYELIRGLYS
jgi:hypothetical protein